MEIATREFGLLAGYIKDLTGIELDDSKRYFLESRIGPLLERHRCGNYADFHAKAKSDTTGFLREALIEAVTTHETSFFRDARPFELFGRVLLPRMLAGDRERSIRIWSAACASGQEAYSLAMICLELLGDQAARQVQIMGTDISRESADFAAAGEYREFEVQRGLSPERLARHFVKVASGYAVNAPMRSLVRFRVGNLLRSDGIGPFDVIFCRNVAIYFSQEDRKRLYANLADRL
jgi:chemotaxis protein methyltransferase CheR